MAMNAREQAKMRRLEIENGELRSKLQEHFEVYRQQSMELIELRSKMAMMREVLANDKQSPIS